MKRMFFILALSSLPFFVGAQDFIDDLIDRYSGNNNFSSIVISKNLLDVVFAIDKDSNNDLDRLKGKISDLKILISENKNSSSAKFTEEIRAHLSNDSFFSLMEIIDGKRKVNFYIKKDNDKIVHLLLLASEADQEVLLSLKGQFSMKELIDIGKDSNDHGSFYHLSYLKSLEK